MDDLIKRSDAVKDFGRIFGDLGVTLFGIGGNELAQTIANAIPSAERKGEWIEDARTYYETLNAKGYFVDQHTPYFTDDIACPNCLEKFSTIDNETERFDYCPHCGCRMKGAEDDL